MSEDCTAINVAAAIDASNSDDRRSAEFHLRRPLQEGTKVSTSSTGSSSPVKVAVTGAAGQIGYALLFRIASGQLLGSETPVSLSLLEIPAAVKAAEGTAMELDDCAFPLLSSVDIYDDPQQAFDGVKSLCSSAPGRAARGWSAVTCSKPTEASSSPRARRSTTGPPLTSRCWWSAIPANTNCLIAQSNAPDIPRERFTAMMRLDHNRAIAQVAKQDRRGDQ